MSDALKYLMQIRPEAMENYFSFIKSTGSHLDDKTKAIISIITKVDKQTDRGFRQYLGKAMQLGVTANEIIDALFVAFPTLGLSKIIWAVDILLEMELHEFDAENLQRKADWHNVMAEKEIKSGTNFIKHCDGKDLFVYRDNGSIRVYDSRCPHQSTRIPETALQGTELICQKHHWKFDIRTGTCIDQGDRPLIRFENKLEDGLLMAFW